MGGTIHITFMTQITFQLKYDKFVKMFAVKEKDMK